MPSADLRVKYKSYCLPIRYLNKDAIDLMLNFAAQCIVTKPEFHET